MSSSDFSVHAFEQFLKHATLANLSRIFLNIKVKSSEIKEMFKRIGKYEVHSSIQQDGAIITLLKNVHEESFHLVYPG
uniref:Uncharacterized protein n=1 Tax=Panagrolaimus sp. JU765 TaxID=591449 RepID=A0AC34R6W2_9BILA